MWIIRILKWILMGLYRRESPGSYHFRSRSSTLIRNPSNSKQPGSMNLGLTSDLIEYIWIHCSLNKSKVTYCNDKLRRTLIQQASDAMVGSSVKPSKDGPHEGQKLEKLMENQWNSNGFWRRFWSNPHFKYEYGFWPVGLSPIFHGCNWGVTDLIFR